MQKRLNRPMLKLKTIPTPDDEPQSRTSERANISQVISGLFIGGRLIRLRSGPTRGTSGFNRHQSSDQPSLRQLPNYSHVEVRVLRLRLQRQTHLRHTQLHRANHRDHQPKALREKTSIRPLLRSKLIRESPARRPS